MARAGYRIFDADTHIIEPSEPIEAHIAAADRAKLAALGPVIGRAPADATDSGHTRPRSWSERYLDTNVCSTRVRCHADPRARSPRRQQS